MENSEKKAFYELLCRQAEQLLLGERHPLANLCNAAALLYEALPRVNWAGFYLMNRGELLLGPFQGKPACMHIAVGKGVCGTAAQLGKAQLVRDVHAFLGHIACDSASNSEVVIPLWDGPQLVGVLDIDSPELSRFDETDLEGLSAFAAVLQDCCDWERASYCR